LITHAVQQAARLADRLIILEAGRIRRMGIAEELFHA